MEVDQTPVSGLTVETRSQFGLTVCLNETKLTFSSNNEPREQHDVAFEVALKVTRFLLLWARNEPKQLFCFATATSFIRRNDQNSKNKMSQGQTKLQTNVNKVIVNIRFINANGGRFEGDPLIFLPPTL